MTCCRSVKELSNASKAAIEAFYDCRLLAGASHVQEGRSQDGADEKHVARSAILGTNGPECTVMIQTGHWCNILSLPLSQSMSCNIALEHRAGLAEGILLVTLYKFAAVLQAVCPANEADRPE